MTLTPRENLLRALRHIGPEWVPYDGDGSCTLVDCRGRQPPLDGPDEWGVTWAPLPASYVAGEQEPASSYPVAPAAPNVRELLARPIPDGSDPGLYTGLLDGCDPEKTLPIGQHPAGPMDRLVSLVGMEEALLGTLRAPEATGAMLDRIADYHCQVALGYLAHGAEAGWLADDYAGQDGPLLRPAHWRRLVLPGLARVIAVYRSAGAPVIFHTCGRAEPFIPDLVAAGVTAFNLENEACDLPALKERFGRRIAFFGGVSSRLMLLGAPDEVRRSAECAMWILGREGGLILAPDQPLAFPPANQAALRAAAREAGRYPVAPPPRGC